MSLTCELSGEPLTTADSEIVVTPSGHACIKRLLLSKLAENGGQDPFEEEESRPLTEDELITLNIASKVMPPRPNAVSSFPSLLTQFQNEYDALILELFDTRKALEETRKELSQALYQNDAAVRVVARLSQERDAARQELQNYKAQGGQTTTTSTDEPETKKRRIETTTEPEQSLKEKQQLPLENNIPEQDMAKLIETWETLHKDRKQKQKEAAASAPSKDQLAKYVETDTKSYHKTSCKGITAINKNGQFILTAGKDKQMLAYDFEKGVVALTMSTGSSNTTSVDLNDDSVLFAAGTGSGKVVVFAASSSGADDGAYSVSDVGSFSFDNKSAVVNVGCHPDGVHVVAASASGRIVLCRVEQEDNSVLPVSLFSPQDDNVVKLTCGALHPDGLIYLAGTDSGDVQIWDFRSTTLAGTLTEGKDADLGTVTGISISNNGYHVAVAYGSGKVLVWDLRKQKVLATLNGEESGDGRLESVLAVGFDDSGKYLAYCGKGGVRVTTVKEWDSTASIAGSLVSGLVWGQSWMASCSNKGRKVTFYGIAD